MLLIKLNVEYFYKQICAALGWPIQSGNNSTKRKQIECIERCFRFYHPIDPKTGKPKKSYVFTEQLAEPVIVDGRKGNGGCREGAGRKSTFPDEEFEYLWKRFAHHAFNHNKYNDFERLNRVYFSSTLLFQEFGFPVQSLLDKIKYAKIHGVVRDVFEKLVMDAVKSATITRLCNRYDLPKNKLSKGILRACGKNSKTKMIDNDLLPQYDEWFAEELQSRGLSVFQAINQGKYQDCDEAVAKRFETEMKKYKVKRLNVIQANDFDVSDGSFIDSQTTKIYQQHFKETVLASIEKSCLDRIADTEDYTPPLTDAQKKQLQNYLDQLLGKVHELTEYPEPELDMDWLNHI